MSTPVGRISTRVEAERFPRTVPPITIASALMLASTWAPSEHEHAPGHVDVALELARDVEVPLAAHLAAKRQARAHHRRPPPHARLAGSRDGGRRRRPRPGRGSGAHCRARSTGAPAPRRGDGASRARHVSAGRRGGGARAGAWRESPARRCPSCPRRWCRTRCTHSRTCCPQASTKQQPLAHRGRLLAATTEQCRGLELLEAVAHHDSVVGRARILKRRVALDHARRRGYRRFGYAPHPARDLVGHALLRRHALRPLDPGSDPARRRRRSAPLTPFLCGVPRSVR